MLPFSAPVRVGFLYAASFFVFGITIPFLPLWLQARGLSAEEIAIAVGAAPVLVRVAATPGLTELADRSGRPVLILRLAAAASLGLHLLLSGSHGFWPLFILLCLIALTAAPVVPLCDSLAVSEMRARQAAFGPTRAAGSGAFIAANILAGASVALTSVGNLIWLLIAAQGLALTATLVLVTDAPRASAIEAKAPPTRQLLKPGLLVAIAAAALIQASHASFYALGSVHWRALDLSGPAIGILWGIGVLLEIVILSWSARLPVWVDARHLLAVGATACIVRWSVMAFDPIGPMLVLAQILHSLTYSTAFLGIMRAVAALAPPGLVARAQGLASVSQGVVMAGGMALAGQLYSGGGASIYLPMAALAALGLGTTLLGWRGLRSTP